MLTANLMILPRHDYPTYGGVYEIRGAVTLTLPLSLSASPSTHSGHSQGNVGEGCFTVCNVDTIILLSYSTTNGGPRMIKKLTKHGNSLALVLDRRVLDLLEIEADAPLNKTNGKCLIVTPAQTPGRQKKFQAALAKANRQYGPALKKLGSRR